MHAVGPLHCGTIAEAEALRSGRPIAARFLAALRASPSGRQISR
jgi:hypothetical protein